MFLRSGCKERPPHWSRSNASMLLGKHLVRHVRRRGNEENVGYLFCHFKLLNIFDWYSLFKRFHMTWYSLRYRFFNSFFYFIKTSLSTDVKVILVIEVLFCAFSKLCNYFQCVLIQNKHVSFLPVMDI